MALTDARILETVVTPAGSEMVAQIQIADAALRDETSEPDAVSAAIRMDITVK